MMEKQMTRPMLAVWATALMSLGAMTSANAQQEGLYEGQTADGNPVTVEVAKTSDGRFGLFFLDSGFTAKCGGGQRYNGDVGNFFTENHFVNGQKRFNFTIVDSQHAQGQIVFENETNASGTIAARAAVLPQGRDPTSAEYCVSPAQSFSVTFQFGGGRRPHLVSGAQDIMRPKAAMTWKH
jgi:hypothetical protein